MASSDTGITKWFKEQSKEKRPIKETEKHNEVGRVFGENTDQNKRSAKCFPLHFPLLIFLIYFQNYEKFA